MAASASAAQRKPAARLRFVAADDLALLREVNAENPFRDTSRWPLIERNVHFAVGKLFSVRALRERLDLLLSQFIANDRMCLQNVLETTMSHLRLSSKAPLSIASSSPSTLRSRHSSDSHHASGKEEEYEEKEKLLQEISDLAREFGHKIKPRKMQLSAVQKTFANEVRDSACAASAAASPVHDYNGSPSADASCSALASASSIFEQMYCSTEAEEEGIVHRSPTPPQEIASTSAACISTPTQQQMQADAQDEPAATIESRRRKRKPRSGNEDQEFLEKRWNHERALKDKEIEVEKERIMLEKMRLEQKQKRWEKRKEMKTKKLEQKYKLRELELEARANELRERQQQNELNNATQQALVNVLSAIAQKLSK